MKNCKTSKYPEGNSKLAWEQLRAKYAPRNTSRLLNLKKLHENSKLEKIEIDPGDWISLLEGYRTDIETIDVTLAISEKDFILHILNNLQKGYDSILDSLENPLDETGNNALTFEII